MPRTLSLLLASSFLVFACGASGGRDRLGVL